MLLHYGCMILQFCSLTVHFGWLCGHSLSQKSLMYDAGFLLTKYIQLYCGLVGFNGLAEIGKHIFLTWDQAASSLCCQTFAVEPNVEFSKRGLLVGNFQFTKSLYHQAQNQCVICLRNQKNTVQSRAETRVTIQKIKFLFFSLEY